MREAHLRYLLAAALVVVAGYGVYSATPQQPGQSPAGDAAATTPTRTPAPTTTAPPEQLAPGLTWEGVTDPWALSHAHANALLDASFSSSSVMVRWTANGSHLGRSASYVQVAAGGTPLHFSYATAGDDPEPSTLGADVAIWREDNVSYARVASENGTTYRRTTASRDLLSGPVTGWDTVYSLFTGVNTTTVERVERDDTTRYRVVSTSQPYSELFRHERSNYSLSALIDSSGLVYRYQVSYDVRRDDRTLHVSRTWRLWGVGTTTPERPAWIEDAENATANRGR